MSAVLHLRSKVLVLLVDQNSLNLTFWPLNSRKSSSLAYHVIIIYRVITLLANNPVIYVHIFIIKTSVSKGGLGMCQPNDFYLIWEFLRFGLTQRKHYSR